MHSKSLKESGLKVYQKESRPEMREISEMLQWEVGSWDDQATRVGLACAKSTLQCNVTESRTDFYPAISACQTSTSVETTASQESQFFALSIRCPRKKRQNIIL